MELTGFAGTLIGWAIMLTAYCVVIAGLFVVWAWLFDKILVKVMIYLKTYKAMAEWLWYRKEFKRWMKESRSKEWPEDY